MQGQTLPLASTALQIAWGLLLVIGLILLLYAVAKKRYGLGTIRPGAIKLVEIRHLMPKVALALVEVRGKEYLLGIGAGQVRLLAPLEEQEEDGAHKDAATFQSLLEGK